MTQTIQEQRKTEYETAAAAESSANQRRQSLHSAGDALESEIAGLRDKRASIDMQLHATLEEEFRQGKPSPSADRLRDQLANLDQEITQRSQKLEIARKLAQQASLDHQPVAQVHQRTQQAFRRAECEAKLQVVDAALRRLETAWADAAAEALTLARAGDGWAENQLRTLRGKIGNPAYLAQGGPHAIALPHVDES